MKTNNFAHLHLHTDYSKLDGLGRPEVYVPRGVQLGMTAMGITDHGNISGWWPFYNLCRKHGVNPILGCEFYFVPDAESAKEEKDPERFHVVMLARDRDGAKILSELNTEAHRRFYYKPLLDRGLLESLGDGADHLVCLSGCAASIISRKAVESTESAHEELAWWGGVFRNLYVELQHHGTDFDRKLNRRLLKLARRHELPWVVTNDPHYVMAEDACHHDALLAIQTAASIDDPSRFRFEGSGYHLRSRAEMRRAFRGYGDAVWKPGVRNTLTVARDCRVEIPEWERKSWHFPRYPKTDNAYRSLRRMARAGLRRRGLDKNPAYTARLDAELRDIKTVGLSDFLLITWDCINHAAEVGIRTGPGRGSVCGCLVAYAIGIHKIDPIRARLRFDRFLNVARPKMPDIDTDFARSQRDRMFGYVVDLYGAENVQRVAAFQTLRIRAAFQTLARAHDISPQDRNRLTKLLGTGWSDEEDESDEPDDVSILPNELREGYPDLAAQMRALVGVKRAVSRHASGVVIFSPDDPIREINPQQWLVNKDAPDGGYFASQYDLHTIEGMGLLKQDFLGLRTLDTIEECVRMVKGRHGIELDPDSWVPDSEPKDRKLYRMLASGDVHGVFQMEGPTNKRGIQEIKCSSFEDIVSCTSLYRAGPLVAGAPKRYLANKRAGEVVVLHPLLKSILADSWGEMIYQEQMMDIAEVCANFDMGLVADLLAAVRFKDPALMEPLHAKFVDGCIDNKIRRSVAEAIWKMIEAQAVYLYNRSHAYAYSFISYQTARLKMLYPQEFYCALLRTVEPTSPKNKARRFSYMADADQRGFAILAPDINASDCFAVCEGSAIRLGFADCRGIKQSTANKIIAKRSAEPGSGFHAYDDARDVLGKVAVETLGALGAFESIGGPSRDDKAAEEITGWSFNDPTAEIRGMYGAKFKPPRFDNGAVRLYGIVTGHDNRKTKAGHKFVVYNLMWTPADTYRVTVWEDADQRWGIPKGSVIRVTGRWSAEFENVSVSDPDQIRVLSRG